jgi:hypothetical protein
MMKLDLTNEISPEGIAALGAVDGYLEAAIRDGRPIEALMATRRLGEVVNQRSKEAARAATDGSWSWTDVGRALGMTKQAAHEKLRARVHDDLAKGMAKVDKAGQKAHAKIGRKAERGRSGLDRAAPHADVESARQKIDDWEQEKHAKLDRDISRARDEIARAEKSVGEKFDRKADSQD